MPSSIGSRYAREFKAEVVLLARSSPEKPIRQLTHELGISDQRPYATVSSRRRSTMASGRA